MGKPIRPVVRMLWHTPEPQKMIAVAARMCYSAMPVSRLAEELGKEEQDRMVRHILSVRHYSVLRHVLFAFTVEGVSRSFSHQFVRHHVGFDLEQRSQHYRRERDFDYELPAAVSGNSDISVRSAYETFMGNAQQLYDRLIEHGVDKADARQVLPNACETQLVVTLNLNAAMNFLSQRACRLNTSEILDVAVQIRRLIVGVIPEAMDFLGPTCFTAGVCYEGRKKYLKSCRRPWQSPTVLWDEDFPRMVRLVGLKDGKHWETELPAGEAFVAKAAPPEEFQLEQGEDSRNQS